MPRSRALTAPDGKYNSSLARNCIKALSMIGSDAALEAMKTWRGETRQQPFFALLLAAHSFDMAQYGEAILAHNPSTEVAPRRSTQVGGSRNLECLPNLKTLLFPDDASSITSTTLSKLTRLKKLRAQYNQPDLRALSTAKGLKDLSLKGDIVTLDGLEGLRELQHLQIYSNTLIDTRALASLPQLKTLILGHAHWNRKIEPRNHHITALDLTGLTSLHTLYLFGLGALRSVKCSEPLPASRTCRVSSCPCWRTSQTSAHCRR